MELRSIEQAAPARPAAEPEDPAPLIGVVRRLSTVRTLPEVMSVLTYAVRNLLHADGATFVLRDKERCFYAEEDAVSPLWKGRRFAMSACISGWCMLNREVAVIPNIYKDARIPIDAYRPTFVKSLVIAPVGEDEPVAAMGAYWSEVRQVGPDEVELLQTLAGAAALAVAYVRLRETSAVSGPRAPEAPKAQEASTAPQDFEPTPPPAMSWLARLTRDGIRANSPEAYGVAVALVAVATLLRVGVGALGEKNTLVFSTYYPAVLLAMLSGGPGPAFLAIALGAVTGYVAFMPNQQLWAVPSLANAVHIALFVAANLVVVWVVERYQRRVQLLVQEDARHLTLAREQNHRVQNALFVVEMIVRESLKSNASIARTINQRIRGALAAVEIRYAASAPAIDAAALLKRELEPFDLERFELCADRDALPAKAQNLVALATRELATNAVKYGALSTPLGRVRVGWIVADGQATLTWRERGGPRVHEPRRRGYGSVLLRRLVEATGGTMKMDFRPEGLAAEIVLPTPSR